MTASPTSDHGAPAPRQRRHWLSPLTRSIIGVNLVGLLLLIIGALAISDYRQGLIDAQAQALLNEGQALVDAIVETALIDPESVGPVTRFDMEKLSSIVHRAARRSGVRIRLYDQQERSVIDSRALGSSSQVQSYRLAPPDPLLGQWPALERLYDFIVGRLPELDMPRYYESATGSANIYEEVEVALTGEPELAVRVNAEGAVVVSAAVPIERVKSVRGALFLTQESGEIEAIVRAGRIQLLQFFLIALMLSVALSMTLSGMIARPIRRLAEQAEAVRRGGQGRVPIRTLGPRRDEIGDLAHSLAHMTDALYSRMDATERFAADVAHEIKNPLTSLRSAVETLQSTSDPARQARLLAIIREDVGRVDRLITDIADASRLDAELTRERMEPVNVAALLRMLAEIDRERGDRAPIDVVVDAGALGEDVFVVPGLQDRLGQVFRNLCDNAQSFSPPGGRVRVEVRLRDDTVVVQVDDAGPGIPPDSLERIFERFYSAREKEQGFGQHSGLGLAIARQIVEAHGGSIRAENRRTATGRIAGARFVVTLPR